MDVTSPKYVPKSADDRAYNPRGGPLSFQFLLSSTADSVSDQAAIIQNLLAAHDLKGYPGRYVVGWRDKGRSYIHVFPKSASSVLGTPERVDPLIGLQVGVAVKENEKNIKVIEAVIAQMKAASGKDILFAGINGMVSQSLLEPASGPSLVRESAAEFFDSMTATLGFGFWQLLYDPTGKFYVLSFRK